LSEKKRKRKRRCRRDLNALGMKFDYSKSRGGQICSAPYTAFFFRLLAGLLALCPAQRASFIIRACSDLCCLEVFFQRFWTRAAATGSAFSFLDMLLRIINPYASGFVRV
jgi:hypothetical protein